MKNIYEIAEPLRAAIVSLDDLQKQIAEIPPSLERKNDLIKEVLTIAMSTAQNSLIGGNTFLVNAESTSEEEIEFNVEYMKTVIVKLKNTDPDNHL